MNKILKELMDIIVNETQKPPSKKSAGDTAFETLDTNSTLQRHNKRRNLRQE